jgi:hypothetical protein
MPTVPFLCTRVKNADVDDWKKLLRLLKYLEDTVELELRLQADEGDILLPVFSPDGSHAVHADYKGHTGSAMTLGKGSMMSMSNKQKLNTKSSTETELVAADEVLDQALWTKNFLEAQGYKCQVTIYQDNTSAILLEKNGQESMSKRTRHLNIRYFRIKHYIKDGQVHVKYCPTDDLTGDYFTKPLQGRKFFKHQRSIMNHVISKIKGLKGESQSANRSVLETTHTTVCVYEVSEPREVELSGTDPDSNDRSAGKLASDHDLEAVMDGAESEWLFVQRKVRGKKPKQDPVRASANEHDQVRASSSTGSNEEAPNNMEDRGKLKRNVSFSEENEIYEII